MSDVGSDEELVRRFRAGERAAFGAIGYVIGVISTLMRLDDAKQLGPCVAVALLSVFYAVVLGELIFGTLRMRTQRYLRSKQIAPGGAAPVAGTYGAMILIPSLPILACFLAI